MVFYEKDMIGTIAKCLHEILYWTKWLLPFLNQAEYILHSELESKLERVIKEKLGEPFLKMFLQLILQVILYYA